MINSIKFLMIILVGLNKISTAQTINKFIDIDSLFNELITTIPVDQQKSFKDMFDKVNTDYKPMILLQMNSLPKGSKKELIENYQNNEVEFLELKNEFLKLIPDSYAVRLQIISEIKLINQKEKIVFEFYSFKKEKISRRFDDWNGRVDSLPQEFIDLGWNNNTISTVKSKLIELNSTSIFNGELSENEYVRIGMTNYYSYWIFDKELDNLELSEFDDCKYITYKSNLILEYGSGVSTKCFPEE